MRVAKLLICLSSFLLGSCGVVSHGRCKIPPTEQGIRTLLIENRVAAILKTQNVAGTEPADYVRRNPGCCSVSINPEEDTWFTLWDKYSVPKYDVSVAVAYRRERTSFIYMQHGLGDSCGRVVEPFGHEVLVEGPVPDDKCGITDVDRARHPGVPLSCNPDTWVPVSARPPASTIPLAAARRAQVVRIDREQRARETTR